MFNGGRILQIYSENIYEIIEKESKQNILIIYNISSNHYVGLPIHKDKTKKSIYIPSINRYVISEELREYSRKNIKRTSIC